MNWPLSKRANAHQTKTPTNGDTHAGTLWAICRRLQAKVTEVESQIAIIRRDINRIDRKGYRDAGATKTAFDTPEPETREGHAAPGGIPAGYEGLFK